MSAGISIKERCIVIGYIVLSIVLSEKRTTTITITKQKNNIQTQAMWVKFLQYKLNHSKVLFLQGKEILFCYELLLKTHMFLWKEGFLHIKKALLESPKGAYCVDFIVQHLLH